MLHRRLTLFLSIAVFQGVGTHSLYSMSDEVHQGNHSVRLTTWMPRWTGDLALNYDVRKIVVTPGQILQLSFWARSSDENIAAMIAKVSMGAYTTELPNTAVAGQELATTVTVPSKWTRFTYNYTVPQRAYRLTLGFRVPAGGTPPHSVMFDDISLSDTRSGQELLENGGFENWGAQADGTVGPTRWLLTIRGGAAGTLERVGGGQPVVMGVRPPPPIKWLNDIRAALATAALEKRKILVFFVSPGTKRSDSMEADLVSGAGMAELIDTHYIPVKLDMATQSPAAAKLGVFRGGTIAIYDSSGKALRTVTDYLSLDELKSRLQ